MALTRTQHTVLEAYRAAGYSPRKAGHEYTGSTARSFSSPTKRRPAPP